SDRDPDRSAEQLAQVATLVLPERDHETAAENDHPCAERAHVDERAARHHQRAEHHQRDRHDVLRVTDEPIEAVAQPATDVAAVPAEVEDGAEVETERDRAEAPELRVLAPRAGAPLRPRLLDAARELRAQLPLPLARHALGFRPRPGLSFVMAPETRYARNGDVSIAYQVFSEGPFAVVLSLPSSSHIEPAWEP